MGSRSSLALFVVVALAGCGDGDAGPGGGGSTDASMHGDAGAPGGGDAGAGLDSGTTSRDGGPLLHDAGTAGDGGGLDLCPPPPACDAAPPEPDPIAAWRHAFATPITVGMGAPRHRGRDLVLRAGEPQWALAKFSYGAADADLKDEDVDMWLLRGCATWERLGTATTTDDGAHATVEGVEDTGGRVYFPIPEASRLEPGWHRIHFVVRGDHSAADQWILVVDPDARVIVTDVDGTLTESETAEFATVFSGPSPAANPSAADALWHLARRGYVIFYLTARPEWLATRTHEWLVERAFPPGIVHTTLSFTGATGGSATTFKTGELDALEARLGHPADWLVGNTATDADAYATTGTAGDRRLFYQFDDTTGGTRFDDYATLVPLADAMPLACAAP